MSPGDVDMVLLVGRATRMPRVTACWLSTSAEGPASAVMRCGCGHIVQPPGLCVVAGL